MARDGSGNYSLPVAEYVNGTVIDADDMNSNLSDIATALTASIAKDGQTNPSANLPMATFRHTGVGAAAARTDYTRADQSQDGSLVYALSSGTDTIAATLAPAITAYAIGQTFRLKKSASANTGAVTLNLNTVGAGAVTWPDGTALAAGDLPANGMFEVSVQATTPVFHLLSPNSSSVSLAGTQTISGNKTFTGTVVMTSATVTVATATAGDNDTSPASTAFVQTAVAARTAVADANVAVADTSRVISFTSITANRNVTLPAANTITAGRAIDIFDASGSVTEAIAIRLVPNGTDTIAGSNTTQDCINIPRGSCRVVCNGTDGWEVEKWSVRYVNTLGADTALGAAGTETTGPTVAQGTVGTWLAMCSTNYDGGAPDNIKVRLWDGTTTIDSVNAYFDGATAPGQASLHGYITTPAGNIRVGSKAVTRNDLTYVFNSSGYSKDCTLTVTRVA